MLFQKQFQSFYDALAELTGFSQEPQHGQFFNENFFDYKARFAPLLPDTPESPIVKTEDFATQHLAKVLADAKGCPTVYLRAHLSVIFSTVVGDFPEENANLENFLHNTCHILITFDATKETTSETEVWPVTPYIDLCFRLHDDTENNTALMRGAVEHFIEQHPDMFSVKTLKAFYALDYVSWYQIPASDNL